MNVLKIAKKMQVTFILSYKMIGTQRCFIFALMKKAGFTIKKLVQKQKIATKRNSKSFNLEAKVNAGRTRSVHWEHKEIPKKK